MIYKHYSVIVFLALVLVCSKTKPKVKEDIAENIITSVNNYKNKKIQVYTTAKDTELRLTKTGEYAFENQKQPLETDIAVFVNPEKSFQEFLGIGGAITDASAEVFSTLNPEQQNSLLQSYFGKDGLGYNIIRTSIHSSDFGLGSYTYITEGDAELKSTSF